MRTPLMLKEASKANLTHTQGRITCLLSRKAEQKKGDQKEKGINQKKKAMNAKEKEEQGYRKNVGR